VTATTTGNGREATIILPERRRVVLEAHIRGLTPLIVHRFGERAIRGIQIGQGPEAKPKKEPRNPQRDFEEALYKLGQDEHGHERYGFPSMGIKKAMVLAGQRFGDEKGTELYGVMTIPGEFVEIESPNPPRMRTDRTLYQGKTLDLAYRPEFNPWEMHIRIIVNIGLYTVEKVVNLLDMAGTSVGIGNWRIDKKGTFGTWEIVTVKDTGES
jgi:hypothetical protein